MKFKFNPAQKVRTFILELPLPVFEQIRAIYRKVKLYQQAIIRHKKILRARRIEFPTSESAFCGSYSFLAPTANEVLVKTLFNAISTGTEVAVLSGYTGKPFPYYPGYSGSGRVVSVGKNVTHLKVGDNVAGRIKHSEMSVVDKEYLFKIPKEVSVEEAALFEIGIISAQGVRKAAIRPGDRTLVIGLGIIGQMALRYARVAGACPLYGAAKSSSKKGVTISEKAADYFIESNVVQENSFDVVIDATGDENALNAAIYASDYHGRIVLLGSNRTVNKNIDLKNIIRKELVVIGAHISTLPEKDSSNYSWTYQREAECYLKLLRRNKLCLKELVHTKVIPEEIGLTFDNLLRGKSKDIGILIDWTSGIDGRGGAW